MSRRGRFGARVMLAVLAISGRAAAQTSQVVDATLTPGVDTTAIVDTSPARFRFALAAEEAIELRVTQPGVDLELRLVDANDQEVVSVNVRHHTQGDERLIATPPSGSYVLSIARVGTTTATATTHLSVVSSRRRATDTDRKWHDGARAFAIGLAQEAHGTGDGYRNALASFDRARNAWSAVGATLETATAVSRIALMQIMLSQLQDAITAGEAALVLWRSIGDRYGEGKTLSDLASTHFRLGDHSRAAELYDQAVALRRTIDDPAGLGYSLMGLAVTRTRVITGWQDAAATYREALQLLERAGDRYGQSAALYNIGYAHKQRNEFATAFDYFERSLTLRRALNDISGQASALTQVAAMHLRLGDLERALEVANDAVALRRQSGDRRGEAYSELTAGMSLARLGQLTPALERLKTALSLAEAVGDREAQTNALTQMARLRATSGAPFEALALAERAQAVAPRQDTFDATVLACVTGDAHLALGDSTQAAAAYRRGLAIAERLGESLPAAEALAGLGRVARDSGDLAASRRYLLEALDRIESVRAGVSQSELQSSFLGIAQSTYESAIETLIALDRRNPSAGYAAEALLVSERKRARAMLDILAEARADLRAGADPTLLDREEAIQRTLNARSAARAAAAGDAPGGTASEDHEIATLVAELRSVRAEIRTRSPKYAALTRPALLDLAGIQQLLDPQTLLLEYSLGEHASYAWAITPTTMTLHQLPGRGTIEEAVLRARDLIARSAERSVRGPLSQTLADLSTMVLGGVTRELGRKRLVIVADGVLQFLPFGALPSPHRPSSGTGDDEPLIVTHEIVMLPSASIANGLRQASSERPGRKAVAVLADPVFQPDDPRVSADKNSSSPVSAQPDSPERAGSSRDLVRAAKSVGVARFERLPHSREEAVAITAKAGRSASLAAVGFDATRELVLSPAMQDFRVMHFATHTVLDGRHPELSGIVLTLVDDRGQSVDGFLRLHDIFNMKLSADIVVLSACQTALGRDVRGEGLIGLTRGFMHAGASQVIASLWDVRDRSTAALMTELYSGLLQRGLTAPAALRAAQIAMWKNPRWRMPVHWAGFIAQGDWRPTASP